jgi:FlaA1/EpsC-like NDP-sugar epimerase
MASVNAHDPKYREAKPPQSTDSTPIIDLFRLDGRTIVITGGAGALGSAVVRAVLESGGDVICLDVVDVPVESTWSMLAIVLEVQS